MQSARRDEQEQERGDEQPKRRNLFTISADLERLEDLLEEGGGELDEALEAWFNELGEERDTKIDNYCALMAELRSRAGVRRQEAARLKQLGDYDQAKADRLQGRLKLFFETRGMSKLQTRRYALTLANNGGVAPLIIAEGTTPESVPARFRKVSVAFDRDAIAAALAGGKTLKFAKFGERGKSLRIR